MAISRQLRALAVTLVLATAAIIGVTAHAGYRQLALQEQCGDLAERTRLLARRLEVATRELLHDARVLAALPSVRRLAQSPPPAAAAAARDDLAAVFEALARAKPHYLQLRLIGRADDGLELVRIDRQGEAVVRVPDAELQHKGSRGYLQAALATPVDQVYVSDIDLNRERDAIVVPHQPTMRAGVAIPGIGTGADAVFGVVIVNLDFDRFLTEALGGLPAGMYLANADGDYLVHPDPALAYGFDLGRRHRLQDEFAVIAAATDLGRVGGGGNDPADGALVQFEPAWPVSPTARPLLVGLRASSVAAGSRIAAIAGRTVLFTASLLAVALLLAWWSSARMVRPLEALAAAASAIGGGQEPPPLPLGRRDEIGDVARAFDAMLQRLRTKREALENMNVHLQQVNRDLEQFARLASHELSEPARRLATLTDLLRDELRTGAPAAAELMVQIESVTGAMLERLRQLREIVRIDQHDGTSRTIDLRSVVATAIAEVPAFHSGSVPVAVADLPTLDVCPDLVKTLYRHLLDGAARAADPRRPGVECTADLHDGCWTLGVRSRPSAAAAAPVKGADARFATGPDGHELEAAICRRIVDRHRGRIWTRRDADRVQVCFTLTPTPR